MSGKKDHFILFRVEPLILENGLAKIEMALGFKFGLMELSTKVNGKTIKLAVGANSSILMEMNLKENGWKIRQMAMASTSMLMVLNMKVHGKTICKTDSEWKHGRTVVNTKVTIKKEKKMV